LYSLNVLKIVHIFINVFFESTVCQMLQVLLSKVHMEKPDQYFIINTSRIQLKILLFKLIKLCLQWYQFFLSLCLPSFKLKFSWNWNNHAIISLNDNKVWIIWTYLISYWLDFLVFLVLTLKSGDTSFVSCYHIL